MPIEIYHVSGTRSVRVVWLCEELGLDYEIIPVDFSHEYRSSPEWRQLHPAGKVPVMTDGIVTIFESGAIVQYLLDKYGGGRLQPPRDSPEYPFYLQWSWFAESTFARPLGEIVNHRRVFEEIDQNPLAIQEMMHRSCVCLEAVNKAMDGREFLLAEMTAADIMMGYTLFLAERFLPRKMPTHVANYWARLKARPACQIAITI